MKAKSNRKSSRRAGSATPSRKRPPVASTSLSPRRVCSMPRVAPREFDAAMNLGRVRLIQKHQSAWVNGTQLEYSFISGGKSAERNVVRQAFKKWRDVGIGLDFKEVQGRADHIRIGFVQDGSAWSYVGREILNHEQNMNFGWDISSDIDTALHEIGHAIGFPHEHQNPNAGIVWNEEAVYAELAKSPNFWDRETTHWNILRKIPVGEVRGSNWDPDSIMHYPFEAGLIREPTQYALGLAPAGGISTLDQRYVREFYPPLAQSDYKSLRPFESVRINIAPGKQLNLSIEPSVTRNYTIETFGDSDVLLVLFEDTAKGATYLSADDDSGTDLNARIEHKLIKGRKYILRARLYYVEVQGECAVMLT